MYAVQFAYLFHVELFRDYHLIGIWTASDGGLCKEYGKHFGSCFGVGRLHSSGLNNWFLVLIDFYSHTFRLQNPQW